MSTFTLSTPDVGVWRENASPPRARRIGLVLASVLASLALAATAFFVAPSLTLRPSPTGIETSEAATLDARRVAEARGRLDEAQRALAVYRADKGIAEGAAGDQDVIDRAADLGRARGQTAEAKARADEFAKLTPAAVAGGALIRSPTSETLDKLRADSIDLGRQATSLMTSLGERHPTLIELQARQRDLRRQIADEFRRVQASAARDLDAARASEAEAGRRVDEAAQARDLARAVLSAATDVDRQTAAAARLAAPVRETAPVATRSMLVMALLAASALGLLLSGALVFAMRRPADPAVSDVDDIDALPQDDGDAPPVLATLGRIGADRAVAGRLRSFASQSRAAKELAALREAEHDPQSAYSRGVAALYDALAPAKRGESRAVFITSAQVGAGKTTLAANLALTAALAGARTLLIDGDRGDPSLKRLLAGDETPAGLILLAGARRVFHRVGVGATNAFDLVPIDAEEGAFGAELDALPDVERIEGIAGNYDFVIIDGCVVADEEARALAQAVDEIILVVGEDKAALALGDVEAALELDPDRAISLVRCAARAPRAA